jgi:hypothetical protein
MRAEQLVEWAIAVGDNWFDVGQSGAKGASPVEVSAGDENVMTAPGQPAAQPGAKSTIAAEDQNTAQDGDLIWSAVAAAG